LKKQAKERWPMIVWLARTKVKEDKEKQLFGKKKRGPIISHLARRRSKRWQGEVTND